MIGGAAALDRRHEIRLAREAMATRFELVLYGSDAGRLRSAGEEALAEIARLERQLSFYQATSDVSWINARAAEEPVRVEPSLFRLLERCQALSADTGGAFDITIAPLMRAWRLVNAPGAVPDEHTLALARRSIGYAGLRLDPESSSVTFLRPGMSVDLGAAGKGYAVDAAIAILLDHGVTSALLQGGTSSVHTIGTPPDLPASWRIGWDRGDGTLREFPLRGGALSVSAVHGKSFVAGGVEYGHVMDPRTGRPSGRARTAIVTGPGSFECDALATALLVLGSEWLPSLRLQFPGYTGAVAPTQGESIPSAAIREH